MDLLSGQRREQSNRGQTVHLQRKHDHGSLIRDDRFLEEPSDNGAEDGEGAHGLAVAPVIPDFKDLKKVRDGDVGQLCEVRTRSKGDGALRCRRETSSAEEIHDSAL